MKINNKSVFIYKDCSSLPILNFYLISELNDLRYLIKGFDPYNADSYLDFKENKELADIFDQIFKEYNELISNRDLLLRDKKFFSIKEKQIRYNLSCNILDLYSKTRDIEVLGVLNDLGFKFNRFESVGPQLDLVIKKIKALKNRIRIEESNYKLKYKKEIEDDNDEVKASTVLDKQALSIELVLNLGYKINIKKTSVSRWVNLMLMAEEKSKING